MPQKDNDDDDVDTDGVELPRRGSRAERECSQTSGNSKQESLPFPPFVVQTDWKQKTSLASFCNLARRNSWVFLMWNVTSLHFLEDKDKLLTMQNAAVVLFWMGGS